MTTIDARPDHRSVRRSTSIAVAAVLASPAAWAASLGLSYVVQDFTCTAVASADAPSPEGTLLVVLVALNATLLAVAVAAGVVSARVLRRARRDGGPALLRFLGAVGVGLAAIVAFGIVLIAVNPLVLEVCS